MKPSKSTSFMLIILCAMTGTVMAFTKRSKEVCNPLCHNCASVEELASPGIGLDLTLDYGTAAIKYVNGTIIDVGKVDGSEEYKAMMQHFVAINQWQIDHPNYQQLRNARFSLKPSEFIDWMMRKYYYFTAPRDLPSNNTTNTLTNMLQQLDTLIIKRLSNSSYPREFINPLPFPSYLRDTLFKDEEFFPYSVHIVMRNSEIITDSNIESALQAAKLSNPGFYIHGHTYNTVTCARPSTFADPDFATIVDISNSSTSLTTDSKIVLAVEYTASALSLNIFSYDIDRNGDILNQINDWAGSVTRLDLGANVAGETPANDLQTYYEEVEKFINETIKQQLAIFSRFPLGYYRVEGLNFSTIEEDNPGVHALLMLGDQPLSRKISLLEPLQNSLGFNDTVASTLRRLDQMDTLYEGARDAASTAKKVSEDWVRFPSKRTCPDAEILRYYREYLMIDWDLEDEVINTPELIIPDVKENEEEKVVPIAPDFKDKEMSEGLPMAGAEGEWTGEDIDHANFIAEPLEGMIREKGDEKAEAEGIFMVQNELKV